MIQLRKLFSRVPSMKAEEAREFISSHQEGTYTLLDVRQPEEYEKEHIPGAKLIPMPAVANSLSELDPFKPIIAY
jgi:rhodanese-related sulfurtransferase